MIVLFLFIFLITIYRIGFGKKLAYTGYLSHDRTNSIKGLFILIVFLSHINGYIRKSAYAYDALGDQLFSFILAAIGQLMVVMFLFYSGYGVMEGIKSRGEDYIRSMPRRRVLTTLLNFDIAVLLFLAVDFLIKEHVTLPQFVLSLVAWENIGNSNWYIFVILVCYLVTWFIAFLRSYLKINRLGGWILLALLCVAILLSFFKPSYWYDTILAFPMGIIYSENRERIERIVDKNYLLWFAGCTLALFAFYFLFHGHPGLISELVSMVFASWIVLITMRIRIDNSILRWCGSHLFPLYIYERIPMMLLAALAPAWIINERPLIYTILCIILTFIIAAFYRYFNIKFK